MSAHEYTGLHLDGAVTASCSCGWVSAYAHAFDKYARGDHEFHVDQVTVHRVAADLPA